MPRALKDFANFVESQSPFSNTLPMKDLDLLMLKNRRSTQVQKLY
jgi:hypothetical protein